MSEKHCHGPTWGAFSQEALALANRLCEALCVVPEQALVIAPIIDRELQLPQRNAALLLAQSAVDLNARFTDGSNDKAFGFIKDMDAILNQLRDALALIKR